MKEVKDILDNFSSEQLEKLKVLLTLLPCINSKEAITLRVFAEEYSNLIKQNRSGAYHRSVESSLKHLKNFFGEQRSIQSLGIKEIENFITHLQLKVLRGYRVYIRTLKAAFNKAVDWGYINMNPLIKVKLPKVQKNAPGFICGDQLSVICDRIENSIARDVVMTGFYTGMRLNEIMNLKWENVDLNNKMITVGDESYATKGRNQRYIPICEELFGIFVRRERTNVKSEHEKARIINTYPRLIDLRSEKRDPSLSLKVKDAYVFCKNDGTKFTGDYISKIFKKACKDAGIDKSIHFHSLRHSFASNLVKNDVSLYKVKELLGHASIQTTEIYSHLNVESLREAIRKLDGIRS